jgi:hypothetical protein
MRTPSVPGRVGGAGSAVVGKPPNMVQGCGSPAVTCYNPQLVFANMLEHLRGELVSCPQPMIIHPVFRPLRTAGRYGACRVFESASVNMTTPNMTGHMMGYACRDRRGVQE